jgi:hypothetical protein
MCLRKDATEMLSTNSLKQLEPFKLAFCCDDSLLTKSGLKPENHFKNWMYIVICNVLFP